MLNNAKILTANKLKIIAMFVMFIDHFATVFLPHNDTVSLICRMFGRMAAPIFCYFIAEGEHYTSNKQKYIIRLLVFAIISHIPYNLAFFGNSTFDSFRTLFLRTTSVILPLSMGLIALTFIKLILPRTSQTTRTFDSKSNSKFTDNIVIRYILVTLVLAICCAVCYTANWNFVAVLWIVIFGIFYGNFKKQILGFCIVGLVCWIALNFYRFGFFNDIEKWTKYPQWFQFGIFLAIPILAMYNGKQGLKTNAMKWLFYIFYPAHLIFLYIIRNFL